MATLEAEPAGWTSWNARITSDGEEITELAVSVWRSQGSFRLDGLDYTVEPKGFWLTHAVLRVGPTIIARAERLAPLGRSWIIHAAGRRLVLESRTWTGREFGLRVGEKEIGKVTREGVTGRRMRLEFPDDLPVALQVFLAYLVLVQIKREAATVAAGS